MASEVVKYLCDANLTDFFASSVDPVIVIFLVTMRSIYKRPAHNIGSAATKKQLTNPRKSQRIALDLFVFNTFCVMLLANYQEKSF